MIGAGIFVVYVFGWIGYVFAMKPESAWEGAAALLCGVVWPVFALGWLLSRPFA